MLLMPKVSRFLALVMAVIVMMTADVTTAALAAGMIGGRKCLR